MERNLISEEESFQAVLCVDARSRVLNVQGGRIRYSGTHDKREGHFFGSVVSLFLLPGIPRWASTRKF
jgi:hypothetical protein